MTPGRVLLLPGDGIGPEVVAAARRVLELADPRLRFSERLVGAAALAAHGRPYDPDLIAVAREHDAILLGAVGDPHGQPAEVWELRPEAALFALREKLDLFLNLRPVTGRPSLVEGSTLNPEAVGGVDILIVRELVGGLYFGRKGVRGGTTYDECAYTPAQVERIARRAFALARSRGSVLHSIDKANILLTGRLWRDVVERLAGEHPDVSVEHMLVDNAALQLVRRPRSFDVLLTENLFGDILSDEAAAFAGGLGVLPSASLGEGPLGLYEPVHGSAPDIAGRGIANPVATILSGALMLRHSLGNEPAAVAIERAVDGVVEAGIATPDVGGDATTDEVTSAVVANVRGLRRAPA